MVKLKCSIRELSQASRILLTTILALHLVSCGDDPELVAKHNRQQAEIRQLEAKLASLREEIDRLPPDRTEDVEKAKRIEQSQLAEIARLEAEFSALAESRRSLQAEFDSYRAKYQAR